VAIKLVVGLGNPESKFGATRHNVGHRVIQKLGKWPQGPELFIPDSYVNASGIEVAKKVRYKKLSPAELLVVCDDFAIPLETLRIRPGGSSGGHNGLKSIIQELGGEFDFPRLRVGVGPVPLNVDPADFVLQSFTREEKPKIDLMIEKAADAVRKIFDEGLEKAMTTYNVRPQ
jgi:PTH1 family peptidyl-tRNA hydrolase